MLIHTVAALAIALAAAATTAGQAQPTPVPAERPPAARPVTPTARPATPVPQPANAEDAGRTRPAPAQREREGQPVNVKLDITITDQGGAGEPSRKTVSMVIADRAAGSIRTGGTQIQTANGAQLVTINVDATPQIQRDGSIRLQFGLEYQPRAGTDPAQPTAPLPRVAQVNERLAVIVHDGKALQISQAADAGSDRRVTVEIKATILK